MKQRKMAVTVSFMRFVHSCPRAGADRNVRYPLAYEVVLEAVGCDLWRAGCWIVMTVKQVFASVLLRLINRNRVCIDKGMPLLCHFMLNAKHDLCDASTIE